MIAGIVASQLLGAVEVPGGEGVFFVAVGSDDNQALPVVMTSEGGGTWTARTGAFAVYPTADLYGVATDGSRWVAVGVDSGDGTTPVILTSDDGGVTWTSRTPGPATNTWLYAVAWTGSAFIAVGVDGSNSAPRVMTSPDGATWTARTADPATDMRLHAVSGKSGLAVAVGWTAANAPKIMSSANDGASWTTRTSAPTTQRQLHGVVCETSRSVIVGVPTGSTTTHIQSSSDGTTWATETGDPTTGVDLYGVGHDGSLFIAVGTDHALQVDPKIMSSPDGDTWTARTPDPTTGINLLGVASHGGVSVAVGRDQGFSTPFIMSSADGINWVERTPDPSSGAILNAIAGGVTGAAPPTGTISGVGSATGLGAASGVGQAIGGTTEAVGAATGIGVVAGVGQAISARAASATGIGTMAAVGVSVAAPLDALSNVTGAWSFSRQLLTSYGGSFYAATSGSIDTLYDQSGGGRNFTQTSTLRPTETTLSGRAAALFDGSDDYLNNAAISNFITNQNGYIAISVLIPAAAITTGTMSYLRKCVIGEPNQYMGLHVTEGVTGAYNFSSGEAYASVTATNEDIPLVIEWWHISNTSINCRVNGGTPVSVASLTTGNMNGALRLANSTGTNLNCTIAEVVTFNVVPSSPERDALVADMMDWIGA